MHLTYKNIIMNKLILNALLLTICYRPSSQAQSNYINTKGTIVKTRIETPDGFLRLETIPHSYAEKTSIVLS
jgi:hypothetical protein